MGKEAIKMSDKTFTQEEVNELVGKARIEARESAEKKFEGWISPDDLKGKTSELDKQVSDLNNALSGANEKIAEHEKAIAENDTKIKAYEINSVKMRVANEKGLSFEAMNFLQGEDEESIVKSAESLKSLVGKSNVAPLAGGEPPKGDAKETAYKGMLDEMFEE